MVILLALAMMITSPQIMNQAHLSSGAQAGTSAPLASTPTGTYFDHVVAIMMENEGINDICGGSPPLCNGANSTFLSNLANNYTIAAQHLSLITTSQPNYIAMISGSMQGCTRSGCPSGIIAPNLADRFENVGLTWKGYFENMTAGIGCNAARGTPEPYTSIHNPFISFQDITNNTSRCSKLVNANPSSCSQIDCALINDLNNATATSANFMWLTPNDCDNMRGWSGCPTTTSLIKTGDTYLSKLVPLILKSRTFTTTRSALFVTFDEGNGFCPGPYPSTEDCVYASWSGPVAKTNYGTGNLYSHYSFTKTIETNWNLASFTLSDANANPMTEFFKNQPANYLIYANPASTTSSTVSKTNLTISLTSINNFTGTVTPTATSTPSGPSLTFNPTSVTLAKGATGTSILTFTSSTTGNYTVLVKATTPSLSHDITLTIDVLPPDFTISPTPSSLAMGQPTTPAGSTAGVATSGDGAIFQSAYQKTTFSAQNLTWLFYVDSRKTCEHTGGCMMYTSSPNGTKWATPILVPVHISESDYSVYTNDTNVFYVRYNETSYDSTCGQKMQLGVGRLSSQGTISWQPEQTILQGASNRSYPDSQIMVDNNNQVWIGYMINNRSACGGTGTMRPEVIHSSGTNYALWTGNMTICVASCHSQYWHDILVSIGKGQVYMMYWNYLGIHGRYYNGTGWGPEENIMTDITDVNNWLFNNGTSISAIYYDNMTETYNYATRSTAGTWTTSLIGPAETHIGTLAFTPSYYSLPDSASYDAKDNVYDLFYMNSTYQKIDQWTGTGNVWTKTTGWLNTPPVPYSDSLTSFIQTSPKFNGSVFYISGSTSFTINTVKINFVPGGNTASFKLALTALYGFTSTVNLSTSITSTTGLSVTCSPSSIPGGTGTSTCNLTASTRGNYTVTVTATSGSLAHNANITVTVLPFPDFTITIPQPSPLDSGQSSSQTITIAGLNGFNGTVSLARTFPTGLSCGTITPANVTGSGQATTTCQATTAGNYTITITGSSGTLAHNATVILRFQDFTMSASSTMTLVGTSSKTIITITPINGFNGTITLSDATPTGVICGSITPSSLSGSGIATLSCKANNVGNYTLSITGASNSLAHTISARFQATDFGLSAIPVIVIAPLGTNTTSIITLASINGDQGTVILNATDQIIAGTQNGMGGGGGSRPLEMAPPANQPIVTVSPASIILLPNGSAQSTLTITVPLSATVANYTITMTANQGGVSHTLQLTLAASDFGIQPSPSSLTISLGRSGIVALGFQSINLFRGNLTISATVSPTGPTATVNPANILLTTTNTSNLTITASANTPTGNYTVTVQATSGTLSHTVTVILTVRSSLTALLTTILKQDQTLTIGLVSLAGIVIIGASARTESRRKPKDTNRIPTSRRRSATYRHYSPVGRVQSTPIPLLWAMVPASTKMTPDS